MIIEQLKLDKKDKLLYLFKEKKLPYKTGSLYQIWQEGSHPELISSDEMLNQKIDYIHYNPVKRGLVSEAVDWIYSSAKYYLHGTEGVIKVSEF